MDIPATPRCRNLAASRGGHSRYSSVREFKLHLGVGFSATAKGRHSRMGIPLIARGKDGHSSYSVSIKATAIGDTQVERVFKVRQEDAYLFRTIGTGVCSC